MPDTQSACCILGVCCPPEAQHRALTTALARLAEEDAKVQATWLLDNFDLVPKGLGRSIVEAYAPAFRRQLLPS